MAQTLVVNPQPSPWDKMPAAIDSLLKPFEQRAEMSDAEMLATTPPDQLGDVIGKLKTPKMKMIAVNALLKKQEEQQQVPLYDATGASKGMVRQDAKILPATATTPHGLTQYVSPDGKQTVQLAYGDPRTDQYAQAGWKPMQLMEAQQRMDESSRHNKEMESLGSQRIDEKNPTEPAMALKAARVGTPQEQPGDKEAKAGLAYLQQGKVETDQQKKGVGAGMVDNPDPTLTGEAALQNYTPEVQNRARAILEARAPYPTGYAVARDPVSKAALAAVLEVDPSYNAQQYKIREQTKKAFAPGGKDAANVTSINTLVGHIDSLDKSIDELGNTWSPLYNKVGNMLQNQTGNAKVKKFGLNATAVENEMATVFKGTTGTDQEVKEWRKSFDDSNSNKQLKGVRDKAIDLLESRLSNLKAKYNAGMGPYGDMQILTPKSRKILEKFVGKEAVDAMEPEKQQQSKGGSPDPAIAAKIQNLRGQYPDERIASDLKAKGIDPSIYGLPNE